MSIVNMPEANVPDKSLYTDICKGCTCKDDGKLKMVGHKKKLMVSN